MTCLLCGDHYSWSVMERVAEHVHLVLEADLFGKRPPCGVAVRADDVAASNVTFFCLRCAANVGVAARKGLKVIGVTA